MFTNHANLHDLCTRIAAGDKRARDHFDRQIPPLVEIVVRRWLRQQQATASADNLPPPSSVLPLVRQLTSECCTRIIDGCRRMPGAHDPRSDETIAARRGGDTVRWAASAEIA